MRWSIPLVRAVVLFLPAACRDPGAAMMGSSETGSESSSSAGGSTIGVDTSTATTESDSSSSESESSSSSSSGGETGEVIFGVELLISRVDAGGYVKAFYYRRDDDGTVEGPLQITPPDASHWEIHQLVPGRRVVYRTTHVGGDDIVLGAIANDNELVTLDTAPVGEGSLSMPMRVPGAEAVLFADLDNRTVYRVDFADGLAQPPALIDDDGWLIDSSPIAIDALGRWAVLTAAPLGDYSFDLALARVDLPDPDGTTRITELVAGQDPGAVALTADADSLFFVVHTDGAPSELRHVDLRDDVIADGTSVDTPAAVDSVIQDVFATGQGGGALYSVVEYASFASELWFTHAEDGIVAAPTLVLGGVSGTYWWMWSSPDGRWKNFHVQVEGVERSYLLDTGDGTSATLYPLAADEPGVAMFAPDSQSMFLQHLARGANVVSRVALADDGPGVLEPIAIDGGDVLVDAPEGVTIDGSMLLLDGAAAGQPAQLLVDLTQVLPSVPTVLSAPVAPGYWAQFGELCSDSRHVGYIERNDVFGPERLMLADVQQPGTAAAVMDDIRGWYDVPADL